MKKRPLSVTVIGCLYIVTGAIGLAFHLTDLKPQHPFQYDIVWISLVRLLAIVSGVYMLRGSNWARWLAIAWIAFHVVLSAFHSPLELLLHALLCAAFAYFLFRPQATQYFCSTRNSGTSLL
ncbi:MAG TPA: hypothetical protein VH325_08345 [Bryobacteraceae bacterium]|jgi:hypothetical protein|nr:hypothetical protein [Bryobacteraceae bacterium]